MPLVSYLIQVPPKSVGAVHIVQLKEDRVVASSKVTKDKGNPLLVREYAIPLDSVSLTYTIPQDGWFYHEATWKDVDGELGSMVPVLLQSLTLRRVPSPSSMAHR